MSRVDASGKLIGLLNTTFLPPKEFTDANLTLGVPEVYLDDEDGSSNTRITLTAVPGRGYRGSVDIFYKRLALDELLQDPVLRSLEGFTENTVVEAINNAFGLFLSPEDFDDFEIPDLEEGQSFGITITAKPDSIGWTGSVNVILEYSKPQLSAVIGTKSLPVQKHYSEPAKGKSGRMLTWGTDFSSIQQALVPDYKGQYKNWQLVQDTCARAGLPGFAKASAVDKATAEVPDANPAFARVVIQNTVVSSEMTGPLYFHYNPN